MILKEASSGWEYRRSENCLSDCETLCYVEKPAIYEDIVVVKDTNAVSDFSYNTFMIEVITKKGGLKTWEEIDCELTDYNKLPIPYDSIEINYSNEEKNVIDEMLLPLFVQYPNISIEIINYSGSPDNLKVDLEIARQRLQQIADYLIENGISSQRFATNVMRYQRGTCGSLSSQCTLFRAISK